MRTPTTPSTARRLHPLIATIHEVAYSGDDADQELRALGMRNYWDGYFASRAAPLGRASAEVVDAVFYNFAPGEVARHIPRVWDVITPEAALAARERGCVASLRRMLGTSAGSPDIARAAELATRAAVSASCEGRPLYAGLRALPFPEEPLARLWHAATLLREHRGDGHNAALVCAGIGRTECHVLHALSSDMAPEEFGRIGHLPGPQLAAVVDGLRDRGLVDAAGKLTDTGRQVKNRIETCTDERAAPAYDVLEPAEVEQLITDLEPIAARISPGAP
ncbi:SCO6745 family protein [Microlunatus soli]|uniref:Uncharacterized protein n=1 Tax=Microlunatus soli TaxID=630515 RepID=A0A1H1S7A3_9ACTN|nr:hypothetical protein [Microlunatus soli]SDS43837.1 hypothetical protein SAMN04489812_1905 [Microlunatus soli]